MLKLANFFFLDFSISKVVPLRHESTSSEGDERELEKGKP